MIVSNSKIKTYRRCPKRYEYRYPLKLRPRAKAIPLEKGTWMHRLLQVWYEGKDWKREHQKLLRDFYRLPDWVREDLGQLPQECARIMKAYIRQYPTDLQRYRIIDCEMDEIVTLPNGLHLNIVVDLILEDTIDGGLWLWDHKFRDKLSESIDMILDPQLTLYFWSLERMGYTDIRGVMYNEVRTKVPTVPKPLVRGGLSKAKNIDTDVWTYTREIRKHELDPNDYRDILQHIATNEEIRFFKRTPIPKDRPIVVTMMKELVDTAIEIQRAERDHRFPRNALKSCKWDCEFKNLCIAELHGADIQSIILQDFEVSHRG